MDELEMTGAGVSDVHWEDWDLVTKKTESHPSQRLYF